MIHKPADRVLGTAFVYWSSEEPISNRAVAELTGWKISTVRSHLNKFMIWFCRSHESLWQEYGNIVPLDVLRSAVLESFGDGYRPMLRPEYDEMKNIERKTRAQGRPVHSSISRRFEKDLVKFRYLTRKVLPKVQREKGPGGVSFRAACGGDQLDQLVEYADRRIEITASQDRLYLSQAESLVACLLAAIEEAWGSND